VRSQRQQVCEHIRRAAQMRGLSLNIDHRYRRLRRNARHIAPNELVQHYIAEHNDITLAHLMKNSFRLAAKITLIAGHPQRLSTNPSREEFGSPWPPANPGRKLSSADLKVALWWITRSIAATTRSTGKRRMHSGFSNSAQKYPGHGWQGISSNTTSFGWVVHGRQCARFDEPKITTQGAPTAAAMCAMPLSLPMNKRAREVSAATSGNERSPSPIKRTDVCLISDSRIAFSFADTIA